MEFIIRYIPKVKNINHRLKLINTGKSTNSDINKSQVLSSKILKIKYLAPDLWQSPGSHHPTVPGTTLHLRTHNNGSELPLNIHI